MGTRLTSFSCFAAALMLGLVLPARATATNIDSSLLSRSFGDIMNTPIVTASRDVEELGKSPANIIVVDRQQIQEQHYRNLVDVLDQLPGFHIQRHTTNTRYHRIGWRGHFDNNRFIIMLDGVRITDPSGSSIAITDNFSLAHIERIEVMYGPASALYGADAVAGIINLISRSDPGKPQGELDIQQGSFHYNRMEGVLTSSLGDRSSLILGGHRYSNDTANLAAYYPQDFAPVDATTFGGTVVVPAASRETYQGPVSANSGFAKVELAPGLDVGIYHNRDVHLTSTGDKPSAVIYNPASIWQQDINTLYLRKEWFVNDHFSMKSIVNASRLEISPTSSYQNIFVDFQSTYKYMRNDRLELDQQFTWDFNPHTRTTFGFTLGQFASIPKTPDLPYPIDPNTNLAAQTLYYPNTTIPMTLYDLHYNHQGGYVQFQHQLSKAWKTTLGLRYDRDSRYGGSWNPRLSVIYRPENKNWLWKLIYGEAFRAPSTFESYETFGSFSGTTDAAGLYTTSFFHLANPNLKPEKTRTLESLWLAAPHDSLFISLSAYITRVDNLIFTTQSTDPALTLPGASIGYIETTANLGTEKFYGGEISLRQEWSYHKLWGNVSLSYSYIDGTLDKGAGSTASDLPFVAKQHLRLQSNTHWNQLAFAMTLHLVGKTSSNTVDPFNATQTLKVPGYTLLDLHLADKAFDFATLQLDINNALDRRYYNSNGSGVRFLNAQQQPRSVIASLRFKL